MDCQPNVVVADEVNAAHQDVAKLGRKQQELGADLREQRRILETSSNSIGRLTKSLRETRVRNVMEKRKKASPLRIRLETTAAL